MSLLPHNTGELYDLGIIIILLAEYFWGRSDTDIRNEARKKAKIRKEKHLFENLTTGEMK